MLIGRTKNMLRCLWKTNGPNIALISKTSVAVGRSPETAIDDSKCPRHHLDVTYDSATQTATVHLLSQKRSFGVNGEKCRQDRTIREGDTLEVLPGEFAYRFEIPGAAATMDDEEKKAADERTVAKRSTPRKSNEEIEQLTTKMEELAEPRQKRSKTDDNDANGESTMGTATEPKTVQAAAVSLVETKTTVQTTLGGSSTTRISVMSSVVVSEPIKFGWVHVSDELMVYTDASTTSGSRKVAGFDLDGTLILTASGRTFAKDYTDWRIAHAPIPAKLKKLRDDGYRVVVFTNQGGIPQHQTAAQFREKAEAIMEKLGRGVVSAWFISPGRGHFRKPMIGMWEEFEREYNFGVPVDRSASFYVGDAAGRGQTTMTSSDDKSPKPSKRAAAKDQPRKDHACVDRLFAMNLGLKFLTPEQFFLDQSAFEPFKLPSFDPKSVLDRPHAALLKSSNAALARADKKTEVVVLVGYPASGKSHFFATYMEPLDYVRVNRDTLGTWQKCVQKMIEYLKDGRSVVVDNTSPDVESRKRYVDAAKANGDVPCRCFVFDCSYDQAMHNNRFRQLSGPDREHKDVNTMVLNTYRKQFQSPTVAEGFEEVIEVSFIPKFDDSESKKLYSMYLLEK